MSINIGQMSIQGNRGKSITVYYRQADAAEHQGNKQQRLQNGPNGFCVELAGDGVVAILTDTFTTNISLTFNQMPQSIRTRGDITRLEFV